MCVNHFLFIFFYSRNKLSIYFSSIFFHLQFHDDFIPEKVEIRTKMCNIALIYNALHTSFLFFIFSHFYTWRGEKMTSKFRKCQSKYSNSFLKLKYKGSLDFHN